MNGFKWGLVGSLTFAALGLAGCSDDSSPSPAGKKVAIRDTVDTGPTPSASALPEPSPVPPPPPASSGPRVVYSEADLALFHALSPLNTVPHGPQLFLDSDWPLKAHVRQYLENGFPNGVVQTDVHEDAELYAVVRECAERQAAELDRAAKALRFPGFLIGDFFEWIVVYPKHAPREVPMEAGFALPSTSSRISSPGFLSLGKRDREGNPVRFEFNRPIRLSLDLVVHLGASDPCPALPQRELEKILVDELAQTVWDEAEYRMSAKRD